MLRGDICLLWWGAGGSSAGDSSGPLLCRGHTGEMCLAGWGVTGAVGGGCRSGAPNVGLRGEGQAGQTPRRTHRQCQKLRALGEPLGNEREVKPAQEG